MILWSLLFTLAASAGQQAGTQPAGGQSAPDEARRDPAGGVPAPIIAASADAAASFTLANGLKVMVRPDRRLPIVTAVVVYNVGAKDELPGQHGYAHLFEHLMLQGSANLPERSTKALVDLGASEVNATTTEDRTIFYETVPRAALERTLFLEADRMGHLAEALTPEKVAREVEVVLNEKRQRGGAPYGTDWIAIAADLYPLGHPYRHGVIGEDADLRAITVADAAAWHRRFYGPANATLILAGDIDVDTARTLATRYFGGLAPRLPTDRLKTRGLGLTGPIRRERFAAVPQARVYMTYPAPAAGSPEIADLDIIAQLMANAPASRLNRRLVDQQGLASVAMVTFDERALTSQMGFVVEAKAADRVDALVTAVEGELARLVAEGPTAEEVAAARAARIAYIRQSQESTFGKAFLLMRAAGLIDDPDYAATYAAQLNAATPESVRRTAAAVYGRPGHTLIVRPMPALATTAGGRDPALGPPPLGPAAPIAFPASERARLANGLEVVLVPRPGAMQTRMLMRFDAGAASTAGPAAAMAASFLTGRGDADEAAALRRRAEALGGELSGGAALDSTDVRLSFDADRLGEGVALLGEVARFPQINDAAVTSRRDAQVAALGTGRQDAGALGRRILRNGAYGADHPYGAPARPADGIAPVAAVTPDAVREWARGHLRPDRARLYVTGDTDMAALRPLLDAAFAGWSASGAPAVDAPPPAAVAPAGPRLTVIDTPGAAQSYITAARLLPPTGSRDDAALFVANEIFGGNSTSRISANLRQAKGWTYGIGSGSRDARWQRFWELAGQVDAARTGDAIAELLREMREQTTTRPPEQAELDRIANASVNRVASRLENADDVLKAMADSELYGRPFDAVVRDPTVLRGLTRADVARASAMLLDPAQIRWVVVGDWDRIRGQLAQAGLGEPDVRRVQ